MKNILIIIILSITMTSCVEYEIRHDGVYYISWNEGSGKSERLIKLADPKTFTKLNEPEYGKDIKNVFYQGEQITGADPKTFKLIKEGYGIDKNRAYYYGDSISTSSSKGFQIIDGYYSKDYKNVFYRIDPLNVCSVSDFRFVYNDKSESDWERWSTDGCYYYMENFKIPSDEYKNIRLYKESGGISSDTKYVYYLDRNIYYDKDGKRILDTIDIKSFKVTGYLDCQDKFGCINVFHGRENCK